MSRENTPRRSAAGCLLRVLLIIILLAAAAAALGMMLVKKEIGGYANDKGVATVEIAQGSSVAVIAQKLEDADVVRSGLLFRLYVRGKENVKLQYGTFSLPRHASYDSLIERLSVYAAAESTRITFPEGFTALNIARRMEEAGLCSAEEFLDVANNGDFSQFRFWQYMPTDEEAPNRFMKCEGYLFPETYDFLNDGMVYDYVATFYEHFDRRITDEMLAQIEAEGFTLHEIITLASFVQEEAGNAQNDNVAQVFRNRLKPGSPFPLLQSNASSSIKNDADNNYLWNWVAPYYGGWDQMPKELIHAYDTYQRRGLPAGPISNPGIACIEAAIHPQPDEAAKDAYFFVTDNQGTYYYGRTQKEHNNNCATARKVNKSMK